MRSWSGSSLAFRFRPEPDMVGVYAVSVCRCQWVVGRGRVAGGGDFDTPKPKLREGERRR